MKWCVNYITVKLLSEKNAKRRFALQILTFQVIHKDGSYSVNDVKTSLLFGKIYIFKY